MKTIELQKGEKIKIIGQRDTHLVIVNIDGEVFTKTGWNRDEEKEEKSK